MKGEKWSSAPRLWLFSFLNKRTVHYSVNLSLSAFLNSAHSSHKYHPSRTKQSHNIKHLTSQTSSHSLVNNQSLINASINQASRIGYMVYKGITLYVKVKYCNNAQHLFNSLPPVTMVYSYRSSSTNSPPVTTRVPRANCVLSESVILI